MYAFKGGPLGRKAGIAVSGIYPLPPIQGPGVCVCVHGPLNLKSRAPSSGNTAADE